MNKLDPHGLQDPEPPMRWAIVALALGFVALMLAVFFSMSDEQRYPPTKVVDLNIDSIQSTIPHERDSIEGFPNGSR